MGIPRLGLRLRGHAKHVSIECPENGMTSPTTRSLAIIDGPGLAHHVYYRCCGTNANITSQPDSYPGYRKWVAAVIAWLDDLSSFGFHIEAIIFDGALPESKRATRLARLDAYAARVSNYRSSALSAKAVLNKQAANDLPPAPFLVAAVVEGLLKSPYAGVTYSVPGEADPYCAVAAQSLAVTARESQRSISIFSDDSDLLVYAVPESTRIIPFRDTSTVGHESMQWDEYWPAGIAELLAMPGQQLLGPAFFMARDTHCTLEDAVKRVKAADLENNTKYHDFLKLFTITHEQDTWTKLTTQHPSNIHDARLSELIHALTNPTASPEPPSMYLPYILDDPTRASAWQIGLSTRILAYSILTHILPSSLNPSKPTHPPTLTEHARSGLRVKPTSHTLLSPANTIVELIALTSHIHATRVWAASSFSPTAPNTPTHASGAASVGTSGTVIWRVVISQLVLSHLHANGIALPGQEDVRRALTWKMVADGSDGGREGRSADGKKISWWDVLHWAARWEAEYCSLRMLMQVVRLVTREQSNVGKGDSIAELREACRGFSIVVEDFPGMADVFASDVEGNGEVVTMLARELLESFDVPEVGKNDAVKVLTRKEKRQAQKGENKALKKRKMTSNPFDLLAE